MVVKMIVGEGDVYKGKILKVGWREAEIIRKGLKLYLDYNPRKTNLKPSYEDKKMAVEMIEAINNSERITESEDK